MAKTFFKLLVVGLFLTGCASSEPTDTKRAALIQMLATSVQVFVKREDGAHRAGSAVVLSRNLPEGRAAILTTAHLLEPPVEQTVFVAASPQAERISVQVLAMDHERDLALLTASLPRAFQVELAPGAELADEILIVAFPWGRQRTVVNGAVSQIATQASLEDPFSIRGPVGLVDATVSYGMSGGGVFDKETGQLVGLVRGYRTAHLALSSQQSPLKLPIAGETTVISTRDIICFLRSIDHERLIARQIASTVEQRDCE